jgi:SNF2 family DNA or RNA helicase
LLRKKKRNITPTHNLCCGNNNSFALSLQSFQSMAVAKIEEKLDSIQRDTPTLAPLPDAEVARLVSGLKLKPHQIVGVNWLRERCHRKHGAILGDEMGLGKTLQVVAFLVHMHGGGGEGVGGDGSSSASSSSSSKKPSLVVAPLAVLDHWRHELATVSLVFECCELWISVFVSCESVTS